MPNFVVQTALINGNDVNICVALTQNVNNPPKGLKQKCDILGIHTNVYLSPKKDSFFSLFNFISLEAITLCAHMDIDLSSIDNIKVAIGRRNEIIDKWEQIRIKCDGDWEKMCDYMAGKQIETGMKSTVDAANIDEPGISNESISPKKKMNYNTLKKGDIAFEGITRSVIFNDDSISLNSNSISHLRVAVPGLKQGKVYTFTFNFKKPDINLFLNDIRAITIHEGYDPSSVKIKFINSFLPHHIIENEFNAQDAAYRSIPYIRFSLNGINEPTGKSEGMIDVYAVPIDKSQLDEAQELKLFIESKVRDIRNRTNENTGGSQSMADELLKYSLLMEKGVISAEEFNSLKKKLLGI